VVPWIHRYSNEQGQVQVCCAAAGAGNLIRDDHGNPIHVLDGLSDNAIVNARRFKQLRRRMLNDRWDPICERCQVTEASGGFSQRVANNAKFAHLIPNLLAQTSRDGTVDSPRVRSMDLRVGNYCNLTCRMCGPWSSKPWVAPYNRVQPKSYQLSEKSLSEFRKLDWVRSGSVCEYVRSQLPNLEALHFAGGEPLIIPEMVKVLELCVDSGYAGQIELSYNTNLTVIPDRLPELWPRFRSVTLICSVDGFGRVNDYIRYPSRWSDIDRNLHAVDEHFEQWKMKQVFVSSAVQNYNVLNLDELFAYLRSGFRHVLPLPNLIPLFSPKYLSIQSLPTHVRDLAHERLARERTRPEYVGREALAWLLDNVDAIMSYMHQDDLGHCLGDFRTFTRNSDREFGDSFEDAVPELARLLTQSIQ
jgi:sulfatase maturation enzyme AslB (radical SAM superfamily)